MTSSAPGSLIRQKVCIQTHWVVLLNGPLTGGRHRLSSMCSMSFLSAYQFFPNKTVQFTLKVDNHFVLPIANPFLLCPDV